MDPSTSASLELRQGALGDRAPVDPGDRDRHLGHRRHDPPPARNLLDELQKPYVVTARAKGMPPFRAVVKYPLRMALNPFIADIGNLLPSVISGSAIVAVVLSLQTSGPMLLEALRSQDQYLAGSFLMFLSLLTVIGMFISDLLLAALDPRIRLTGGAAK